MTAPRSDQRDQTADSECHAHYCSDFSSLGRPVGACLPKQRGNVSMSNLPPQVEAYQMATQIAEEKIRSIVINMEHVAFDQAQGAVFALLATKR